MFALHVVAAFVCIQCVCATRPPHWTGRAGLYFGLRETQPNGLLFGVVWTNALAPDRVDLRHGAWTHHKLQKWGWTRHDGSGFGLQHIGDEANGINLTTAYIVNDADHSWRARIDMHGDGWKRVGQEREAAYIALFVYVAAPDGMQLHASPATPGQSFACIHGRPIDVGDRDGTERAAVHLCASAQAREPSGEVGVPADIVSWKDVQRLSAASVDAHSGASSARPRSSPDASPFSMSSDAGTDVWDVDALLHEERWRSLMDTKTVLGVAPGVRVLPAVRQNDSAPAGNIAVLEFTLRGPCSVHMHFGAKDAWSSDAVITDDELHQRAAAVDAMYCRSLHLCGNPNDNATVALGFAAAANLLGSLTYFAGTHMVATPGWYEVLPVTELYTGVPSRPFFPRGFLWDEGFHQTLIGILRPDLTRAVLNSWFTLMDESGWIPREVILGDEARSRVHPDFHVQFRDIGNPPTLLMALHALSAAWNCNGAATQSSTNCRFLYDIVPRAELHLRWLMRTQAAERAGAYRWRGSRKGGEKLVWHHFASGMDDHPRGLAATEQDEAVDLLAWIGAAAGWISAMYTETRSFERAAELAGIAAIAADELSFGDRYWNEEAGIFCDISVVAWRHDGAEPVMGQACHVGYNGIFPFLLRMLPITSPRLVRILGHIRDPEHLWSSFGLRALSKSDPLYGTEETFEEDYWRSSIWLNMNWLAVGALRHYASLAEPNSELAGMLAATAAHLRDNVVRNVVNEYERTGFLWEHFDSVTGRGRGTHPFTGWSALIAAFIGDKFYLP